MLDFIQRFEPCKFHELVLKNSLLLDSILDEDFASRTTSSEMQRAKFMAAFQVLLAPGAYAIETAALYFRIKFIAPLVLLKERRGR